MDIETNLLYRRKDINKAIKKIHETGKKSNLFTIEPDFRFDAADGDDRRYAITTDIIITPKKRLSRRLDKLFGETDEENDIKYHWTRKSDGSYNCLDNWSFLIWGRELCDDINDAIHDEIFDYDSCPCPKEFKEYCQKTNAILRKYSRIHL